jgi:hypothetical protein
MPEVKGPMTKYSNTHRAAAWYTCIAFLVFALCLWARPGGAPTKNTAVWYPFVILVFGWGLNCCVVRCSCWTDKLDALGNGIGSHTCDWLEAGTRRT